MHYVPMRKDFGLEQIFRRNLQRFNIAAGDNVLIAISGGLDSMSLLKLALEAGLHVSAFHYNYGLRGHDSLLDQILIEKECKKLQIPLFLKVASDHDFSAHAGIQVRARELRYNALEDCFIKGSFKAVFTAHHADDIAETVLMNLSRGTGISGLKGIPVSRSYIIRPLFNINKKAILNYAQWRGLAWREDQSNRSDKYTRNLFRNTVLPELEKSVPGLKSGLSKSALQVSSEWENFHFLIEKWRLSFVHECGPFQLYDPSELLAAPHPDAMGLRLFPEWNLSGVQWKDLIKALRVGRSGACFSGKYHDVMVYKSLIFYRAKSVSLPTNVFKNGLPDFFSFGNFSFMRGKKAGMPSFSLPNAAVINIKTPVQGQKLIFPDGVEKSLLKTLHKEAIHPWIRAAWPVFCDEQNAILAVPGFFSLTKSLQSENENDQVFSWFFS